MRIPLLLLAGACLLSMQSVAAATPDRPNIILVMADDMGYSDLGCYGGEINTPTIDKLASEGIRFSQFYNCASCGPSRASLMTGCYPWKVGQHPGTSIFANLDRDCVTLMQLMKTNGYTTCAVGRLDMVTAEDWHQPAAVARAVDYCLGSPSGGPGNYYKEEKGTPWFKDGKRWERPTGAYSTGLISEYVNTFITHIAKSDKPFFLYMSHYAPHWPLHADEQDIAPYRNTYKTHDRVSLMKQRLKRQIEYGLMPKGTTLPTALINAKQAAGGYLHHERMAIHAAMVESIDKSVAGIVTALKKTDKLENTVIMVLSDNGASHQMNYDKGRKVPKDIRPGSMQTFLNQGPAVAALNNTPLRNYKTSWYEGGISSPLIISWPAGVKNGGRLSHRLSHISDITPTCLELAGITHPAEAAQSSLTTMDGKSLLSIMRNESDTDRPSPLAFRKAVRDGDWKLVWTSPLKKELYNLSTDRTEQHNLAAEHPERVELMSVLHTELFVY